MSTSAVIDGSPTSFAERVRLLIAACGSVTRIARTCGFSEGVVRSWRDGRSDPSRERCLILARRLGVSLLWLIAGEGAMWDGQRSDAAATADGAELDQRRLTAAVRALQSALQLAGGDGEVLASHADLVAEYYALMGLSDPLQRADKVSALHRRLAQRVHGGAAPA